MKFIDEIVLKLVLRKGFKYYPEDKYFIRKIVKLAGSDNLKVLDVGCGNGHYSFLFEDCGAEVIAFDYDEALIKRANEKKMEVNSKVEFLIADGRYPEKYFSEKFKIVFLCAFALFGTDLNKEIMEKYLSLLDCGGTLVFVHNSNLTATTRKTNWRNHKIEELNSFFGNFDCKVENIYFYDRHIIVKLLRSFTFNSFSTKMHILISKITTLPCCLVFVVKKN